MKQLLLFLAGTAIGILVIILVVMVFTGKKVPFVSSLKGEYIALLIIGMTMCAVGPLQNVEQSGWTNPFTIIAIVIGSSALLLSVFYFIGSDIFNISEGRKAFTILSFLILSKWAVSLIHVIVNYLK